MRVKKSNDEVLMAQGPVFLLDRPDLEALKEQSLLNRRQRIRICAHSGEEDRLHEMFIVHKKGAYMRPHKHLNKIESVHVIEGLVDVVLFDEAGTVTQIIRMGALSSGRKFYYRMAAPSYHTLFIISELLVFHEITNGPFRRPDTVFAPWAPDEGDTAGQVEFMGRLAQAIEKSGQ